MSKTGYSPYGNLTRTRFNISVLYIQLGHSVFEFMHVVEFMQVTMADLVLFLQMKPWEMEIQSYLWVIEGFRYKWDEINVQLSGVIRTCLRSVVVSGYCWFQRNTAVVVEQCLSKVICPEGLKLRQHL